MPRGPSPNSKSEFIRKQPSSLSAAEIVGLAKAAGHELTPMFVHNIRSRAKAKAKGGATPKAPAAKKTVKGTGRALSIAKRAAQARAKLASKKGTKAPEQEAPAAAVSPVRRGPGRPRKTQSGGEVSGRRLILDNAEQQLAALIVELGTGRAQAVFDRVKDVLSKLSF